MKTVLLAVVALALQFPVPVPPGPKAAIEGMVVNARNQPISGADVVAFWSPPPAFVDPNQIPRTVTDNDGRFALRDLGAGGYRVRVGAPGYVPQEYGTLIPLTPGQTTDGITLRLVADSVISGRITTTNGSPLLRMEVYAFRKVYDAYGWASFAPQGVRGETNDRGEYRITGLGPGKYYIRASSMFWGRVRRDASLAEREGRAAPPAPSPGEYAPIYYPGVSESSRAAQVDVQSGLEVRNIDIALPRLQLYAIRGKVTDSGGGLPTRRVSLGTVPANADFVSGTSMSIEGPAYDPSGKLVSAYRPDGTFELTDVAPGTYWLNAQLQVAQLTPELRQLLATPGVDLARLPVPTRGTTLVRVIDSDVENVEVTIVHDLTVNGSVAVESGSPVSLDSFKLELRPITIGQLGPVIGVMTKAPGGRFTYTNITAAEYRVTTSGIPEDLYIKESRLGNIDTRIEALTLTRQPEASLEIKLAKGAEVAGTVTDAASKVIPNQQVVLIPDRLPNRFDLYKTATTDANGRFTIRGVAPGEYKAYSWQTLESFRYFDSNFVREFEDRGSAVHVTEASAASANVKLIP